MGLSFRGRKKERTGHIPFVAGVPDRDIHDCHDKQPKAIDIEMQNLVSS
jgi:hypothetical protein